MKAVLHGINAMDDMAFEVKVVVMVFMVFQFKRHFYRCTLGQRIVAEKTNATRTNIRGYVSRPERLFAGNLHNSAFFSYHACHAFMGV